MQHLRLEVLIPTLGVVEYAGRARISEVDAPTETTVYGLRRHMFEDKLSETSVQALAYIPPSKAAGIDRADSRWVGDELFWCWTRVARNKKSLAPFLASGDRQWLAPDAVRMVVEKMKGAKLDCLVARAEGYEARVVSRNGMSYCDIDVPQVGERFYNPTGNVDLAGKLIIKHRYTWGALPRGDKSVWMAEAQMNPDFHDQFESEDPCVCVCRLRVAEAAASGALDLTRSAA